MTSPIGSKQRHCGLRIDDCGLNNTAIRNPQCEIRNRPSGFTFIELIFIAVALTILLVFSNPRMQGGWVRMHQERVAFQLAQTLRIARTLAVTQHQPIEWRWDSSTRRVSLVVSQDDGSSVAVSGRLGKPYVVPAAASIAVLHDGQPIDTIGFAPDGTSQTTTVMIGNLSAPVYQVALDGTTSQVTVH